jgi:hypothetical protein
MIGKGKMSDSFGASLVAAADLGPRIVVPKFTYDFVHISGGEIIDEWSVQNVVTTEGAKHLLDVYFGATAKLTTWYLGLIAGASYSTPPAITNTAANLSGVGNGWGECSATYAPNYSTPTGTTRGAISFAAASGTDPVSKASSATVDITFSATGTVKGAFIAGGTDRLTTTTPLYSVALFGADKTIGTIGDQLKVTVTVSLDI